MANNIVHTLNIPATAVKINRNDLPKIGRGIESKSSVTVHDNGRFSFSTASSKALGIAKVFFIYVPQSREMYVVAATPTNVKKHKATPEEIYDLKVAKKGNTFSVAVSALLQSEEIFNGELYLYKESGNQTFEAVDFPKEQVVVFQLPKGKLTPRVIQPRKRREPKDATAVGQQVNGAVMPTPVAESEDVLQLGE